MRDHRCLETWWSRASPAAVQYLWRERVTQLGSASAGGVVIPRVWGGALQKSYGLLALRVGTRGRWWNLSIHDLEHLGERGQNTFQVKLRQYGEVTRRRFQLSKKKDSAIRELFGN